MYKLHSYVRINFHIVFQIGGKTIENMWRNIFNEEKYEIKNISYDTKMATIYAKSVPYKIPFSFLIPETFIDFIEYELQHR